MLRTSSRVGRYMKYLFEQRYTTLAFIYRWRWMCTNCRYHNPVLFHPVCNTPSKTYYWVCTIICLFVFLFLAMALSFYFQSMSLNVPLVHFVPLLEWYFDWKIFKVILLVLLYKVTILLVHIMNINISTCLH